MCQFCGGSLNDITTLDDIEDVYICGACGKQQGLLMILEAEPQPSLFMRVLQRIVAFFAA